MPELQLLKINLKDIGLLEKLQDYSLRKGQPVIAVVVDFNEEVFCGEVERILLADGIGTAQRDLTVKVHSPMQGYKFDHEIAELYVIGTIW